MTLCIYGKHIVGTLASSVNVRCEVACSPGIDGSIDITRSVIIRCQFCI